MPETTRLNDPELVEGLVPRDLYRFYDIADRLLYVGISLSAAARASQHQADKAWWGETAWMYVEHLGCCSKQHAETLERDAIRNENPVYNIAGRSPRPITPSRVIQPPLGEVGQGVYEAIRHLLTASSTYSPMTREDIVFAIRDGVREAISEHIEFIAEAIATRDR